MLRYALLTLPLDDIKEKSIEFEKEFEKNEALNLTVWRTHFGGALGLS
jgi:hypothetical protein